MFVTPASLAPVKRSQATPSSPVRVRGRAEAFLRRLENADLTQERVRYLRALEVLATADTSKARGLVERLAGGAPEVWETEAAQQALRTTAAKVAPK